MRYDKGMMVELKPETERLVLEEIEKGHFASIDEIIESAIRERRLGGTLSPKTREEAFAHIREMQGKYTLPPGVTIRQLIDEGRD